MTHRDCGRLYFLLVSGTFSLKFGLQALKTSCFLHLYISNHCPAALALNWGTTYTNTLTLLSLLNFKSNVLDES